MSGPAFANGKGLAVVVNGAAGSPGSDDAPEDLARDLPDAELIVVDDSTPFADALAQASRASVLGIVGGDGSINAAAERALDAHLPIAVFPGGTLNHFARDLGLTDATDTIRALRHGDVVEVDVGTIHGKPFLNTASFGMYAELVDARERLEGRLGKWAAMLIAAVRVLRHAEPVRVELDGERLGIWMIFIGNCEYQPAGLAPAERPRLDDGLFDVRYVDDAIARSRSRLLAALATGRLSRANVFTRRLVSSLEIRSLDGPLRLARDGETFDGDVNVHIAKHPDRLTVYAPKREG